MFKVSFGEQHIHADAQLSDAQVLQRANDQAAKASQSGKLLVDLMEGKDDCPCGLEPPGKGWTVIIHHLT